MDLALVRTKDGYTTVFFVVAVMVAKELKLLLLRILGNVVDKIVELYF